MNQATMDRTSSIRIAFASLCAALAILSTTARAQTPTAPWTVTVRPTLNPTPAGSCGAVSVTIMDARNDVPRNAAGLRVTIADFDMAVTAPDGKSLAGQYIDPYHWSVCACQGAPEGTVGTITATYPARMLDAKARVQGVAMDVTTTVATAKPNGTFNPPSCSAAAQTTVARQPAGQAPQQPAANPISTAAGTPLPAQTLPSAGGRVAASPTPVGVSTPISPTAPKTAVASAPGPKGVIVTGTPGSAKLEWQPMTGLASYLVVRKQTNAADVPYPLAATNLGMYDIGLQPATPYTWVVTAIYSDGRTGTTPVSYTTPQADNPKIVSAKQIGAGKVQISWDYVMGPTHYVVFGPGSSNGGVKVTDTTTYIATGVPLGVQEWSVGSYYDPGAASTGIGTFPKVQLNVSDLVLSGWVDLHTHPMINLAFGGNVVHGGVDVGSLLPRDTACNKGIRATSIEHALSNDRPTHGSWDLIKFQCGDNLRNAIMHEFQSGNHALVTGSPSSGYPGFGSWPKWNDITHQKMWYEWVKRARDGGLRVMVALTTNNATLGGAVSGPGDLPSDDKASGDIQLNEMIAFINRHSDFMEVALGSADIKRIVQSNKIAVVLGVELDNIGNFNKQPLATLPIGAVQVLIANEIQRLYSMGVRYAFPVHVLDNQFGGTAIYQEGFNTSNLREAGYYWNVECADVVDDITYNYHVGTDPLENTLKSAIAFAKLGLDPFRHPGSPPVCTGGNGKSSGHRNARGLTPFGVIAVKEMMKRGMIIDIDHMSTKTADATLTLAESFGYPLVSGHTGIRGMAATPAENSRTLKQMGRLSKLHGIFGLGSDGVHSHAWALQYQSAMSAMGYLGTDTTKAKYENGAVVFGTDLNGLVKGPKPGGGTRVKYGTGAGQIPQSWSGDKYWDYNTEGVAHYGMLWDFIKDVETAPSNAYTIGGGIPKGVNGKELVDGHLMWGANYFWKMWERIEAKKGSVQ